MSSKEEERRVKIVAGGEDLMLDPEAVELGKERIGGGATSRVFKGKFTHMAGNVTVVACKEFVNSITAKHRIKLTKEITCLKKLRHPNILHHFGVDFNRSILIMELLEKEVEVEGGVVTVHSARELLDLNELTPVSWVTRLRIMKDVTAGLSFLHNQKIIHCDLKAGNIFIGDNGEGGFLVKLGDFGTARYDFEQFSVSVMPTGTNADNSIMCTAAFTAPELLERGARPSLESDIYSLGMVMAEFSLPDCSTPWEGEVANSSLIYDFVRRGQRPSVNGEDMSGLNPDSARQWMTLLHACWEQNASKRPTSTEADLKMSYLASAESADGYMTLQQFRKENRNILFVPLNTHQGMAVEVVDEVISNLTAQGVPISSDLNRDLASHLNVNDGSNACVYLCTKIADDLLKNPDACSEDKDAIVKRVSEETIRDLPKLINPSRTITDFVDVDEALRMMHQLNIITTQYKTTELLGMQSSLTLREKQSSLKCALTSFKQSISAEGKAFAIYLCHPFAILIGMLRSSFVVVDTHKVPVEAGDTQSGILLQFDFDDNSKEKAIENMVEWISLRMKASITNYATELHSLLLLETEIPGCDKDVEIVTSDTEDQELVNTSVETERQMESLNSDVSMENNQSEQQKESADEVEKIVSPEEDVTKRQVDSLSYNFKMESQQTEQQTEVGINVGDNTTTTNEEDFAPWASARLIKPPLKATEIIWKGHLTRFGLSSFKPFQIDAVNAVEAGMDTVIIQPTGSGKSLCYQLPALFDCKLLTIVVCPTLSLINSQIQDLRSNGIEAAAVGPSSGGSKLQCADIVEDADLPPLLYTTPEYFETKLKTEVIKIKDRLKLLVLDEVHKMFDRTTNFRECYDSIKSLKDDFPGTPIMALTATLSDQQLRELCTDHLRKPVLLRCSVNKKNIKINIEKYNKETAKSSQKTWTSVAKQLQATIQDEYAIVYMDFKNDVKLMVESLKAAGIEDVRAYHGGLGNDIKIQIDKAFREKEFQVLVATEAYEVGTHSPHVNVVFRVGCMRNLAVLIQEFGRAGRNDEASDGFLLVNESKDDQRLIFWTMACHSDELQRQKDNYEAAWKWIYGLRTGLCLRESLLKNFEEVDVLEQPEIGECCPSCDIVGARDFDIKDTALLLLKAINELKNIPGIKGVNEDKLITWIRGAKRDWLAGEQVQKYIDNSETYRKGLFMGQKCLSKEWWSSHLRQLAHLELIDINFKINRTPMFSKTWRTFVVSTRGQQFLDKPCSWYVLPPLRQECQTNIEKKKGHTGSKTRDNKHHLPKIRE